MCLTVHHWVSPTVEIAGETDALHTAALPPRRSPDGQICSYWKIIAKPKKQVQSTSGAFGRPTTVEQRLQIQNSFREFTNLTSNALFTEGGNAPTELGKEGRASSSR